MAETKRRPHADVAEAFGNGKVVRKWLGKPDGWWYVSLISTITYPDFLPSDRWEIAPEPKPDVVSYDFARIGHFSNEADARACAMVYGRNILVRFTEDGETGALKDAEVLSREGGA